MQLASLSLQHSESTGFSVLEECSVKCRLVLDPDFCSVSLAELFYDNWVLGVVHNDFFEICRQEIRVLVHAEVPLVMQCSIRVLVRSGQGTFFNNILVF